MLHGWCSELSNQTKTKGSCRMAMFKLQHTSKVLGGQIETQSTGLFSHPELLEWKPRICISNKVTDGAYIAGLGTTLSDPWIIKEWKLIELER